MFCNSCQREVAEFSELTPAGIVLRCSNNECGAILSAAAPVGQPPVPPAPTRAATRAVRSRTPDPTKSFDVVKAAKARLREVERELKTKASLEKERDQLKRLIGAAERPIASVKPIRGAKGGA